MSKMLLINNLPSSILPHMYTTSFPSQIGSGKMPYGALLNLKDFCTYVSERLKTFWESPLRMRYVIGSFSLSVAWGKKKTNKTKTEA